MRILRFDPFQVGRMGQSDAEIEENVLEAVRKLATHVPGEWNNIQGLSLKLESTQSIPLYVRMGEFLAFPQCLVRLKGLQLVACLPYSPVLSENLNCLVPVTSVYFIFSLFNLTIFVLFRLFMGSGMP